MRRLTINFDLDGVIYDFNSEMTRLSEGYLMRPLPASTEWDVAGAWGLSDEDWYRLFNRAVADGVFLEGKAIEGAVDAVLHTVKWHRVRIITSKQLRYPRSTLLAQRQVLTWLHTHGILNEVELCFTENKQGYEADVIVDDKPDLKWAQSGKINLLFDQPWNQRLGAPSAFTRFTRVYGWEDVLAEIEKASFPIRVGSSA